jgi:hypothetical protein
MVRCVRFWLALPALLCAASGCAVIWDAGELGEPLEAPAADRPPRITDANVPADVTNSEQAAARSIADPSALQPPASSLQPPAASDDAGLEELIAQGRRQGTLSAQDEARLRADMADVPPELRRQIVATFSALNNPTAAKPNRSTTAETSKRASSPEMSDEIPAVSSRKDDAVPPPQQPPRHVSNAKPAKSTRPLLKSAESVAATKVKPSTSPITPTVNPAADEPPGGEWQVMLAATIRSLEESLATPSGATTSDDVARRQAQLRMLYLLAGRRDDALRPIAEAEPPARQFWTDWLYGTATYLDPQIDNPARRATVAVRQLEDAVSDLAAQANLEVCNLAFCRRVTSFGVYESFTAPAAGETPLRTATAKSARGGYVFAPNQEVLLYAEVRNFTSRHTDRGYHTALRPSYQVFDASGRRLGTVTELGESHDYCQHRRRDFFVRYHLYLPSRIEPGDYKLKLTIEDINSTKVAEGSLEFSIGTKPL